MKLLVKWQDKLNLNDWLIGFSLDFDVKHSSESQDGVTFYVSTDPKYKTAAIHLRLKDIPKLREEVIIHELVHIRMDEITEILNKLQPEPKLKGVVNEMVSRALERTTSDITRIILQAYKLRDKNYKWV